MYCLVLLSDVRPEEPADVDHPSFIDSLVRRNLVLLGGPFGTQPMPGVSAAYVLRCADDAQAKPLWQRTR